MSEAVPGRGSLPHIAEAVRIMAQAAVRSDGNVRTGFGFASRTPTERWVTVEWGVKRLRMLAAADPESDSAKTNLGEALARFPARQAEATTILEDLAKRNAMTSAEGYAALSFLRAQAATQSRRRSRRRRARSGRRTPTSSATSRRPPFAPRGLEVVTMSSSRFPSWMLAAGLALGAVACSSTKTPPPAEQAAEPPAAGADVASALEPPPVPAETALPTLPRSVSAWLEIERAAGGDAAHGKKLAATYECNRCHEGTGHAAPPLDRQCVGCHKLIVEGRLPVAREKLVAWQAATTHYLDAPSLAQLGERLRPSSIANFLREPQKLRSHLSEWMPRLDVREEDAKDLAAYLTSGAAPLVDGMGFGNPVHGKDVVQEKGCFACHAFTGAARGTGTAALPDIPGAKLARGILQAPDLRFARERLRPDVIVRWIQDPASVKKDAVMPTLGLTEQEARDAAAYIMMTPLAAPPEPPKPIERLPLLTRKVTYEEVATRVFEKSCVHCHADPDENGDGGPGSTGGFGFKPRGVRLLNYAGTQLGYIAEDGKRRSLFAGESALEKWGGSRLVAALVARHEETAGRPVAEVRGMPMGLPGLSLEEIQLVETWVAQGARP